MSNNIIVVKLGGTEGVDFSAICQDAARLLSQGQRLVLIHGGSAEANQLGEAVGYPPRFITSPSGYTSRYTDPVPWKYLPWRSTAKSIPCWWNNSSDLASTLSV